MIPKLSSKGGRTACEPRMRGDDPIFRRGQLIPEA